MFGDGHQPGLLQQQEVVGDRRPGEGQLFGDFIDVAAFGGGPEVQQNLLAVRVGQNREERRGGFEGVAAC